MSRGALTPEGFDEERAAAEEKFDVVQSTGFTLLLDLDTAADMAKFERVMPKVREHYAVKRVLTWHSKSGNIHKVVELGDRLGFLQRIALQAALGSDGVKEFLSVQRWLNGCENPSLLFRPKDAEVTETE